MARAVKTKINEKYGFPLFSQFFSTEFLVSGEKLRVSDIWGLWHYIIKRYKNRFPSTDYPFLLSLVEQAQYFYLAASTAPLKSQPLLYYYSFLNISKVFLTLRDPSLKASGKEYNHGIDCCNINKRTRLNNAYVSLKSLIEDSGSMKKISVAYHLSKSLGDNIQKTTIGGIEYNKGPWDFSVKSLFQACVGIHRTVSESFKEKEHFIRLNDPIIWKTGKNLDFKSSVDITPDILIKLQNAGYNITRDDATNIYSVHFRHTASKSSLVRKDYIDFADSIKKQGIWHYNALSENRMYICPFRFNKMAGEAQYTLKTPIATPNLRLSSGTVIYFIMFFLGSITRYHPYLFESLLSDKDIWMIGEFLKTQPYQFMNILLSTLMSTPLFTSRMPQ